MIKYSLRHSFFSSHQLRLSRGLESLHSHQWQLQLYFTPIKKTTNFYYHTFHLLKSNIRDIIDPFKGKSISSHDYFKDINPSTENIARFIFNKIDELSSLIGFKPLKVTLWETEDCCASWIRE